MYLSSHGARIDECLKDCGQELPKEPQCELDHVDVSSDAPMQKHGVLRGSAAAAGAGGEGDITP